MTIESLFYQMNTICPAKSCRVDEFPSRLKESLDSYKSILNDVEIHRYECTYGKGTIIKSVDKLVVAINEAVNLVYHGKSSAAYDRLKTLVTSLGRLLHTIDKGHSFYRMRSVQGPEKNKIGFKEMFHIPFNKRGIVSTQRYSTPGYPCLYLGEHSYGCWEELGQKDLDSLLVSRLENSRPLELWDLRIPNLEELDDPLYVGHSMILFPLVIASTFNVDDSNISFKPEYIIPQFLLQLIIDSPRIDGIIYTSVHKNNDYEFHDSVFTNYVFPVKEYSKDYSFCPQLCETFKITKPTCEEYLKIQHGSDLASDYDTLQLDENWSSQKKREVYNYNRSLFGNIEKWLNDETYFCLVNINPV